MFSDDKQMRTLIFLLVCIAGGLVVATIDDEHLPAKLILGSVVICGLLVSLWSYWDMIRSE